MDRRDFGQAVAKEVRRLLLYENDREHRRSDQIVNRHQGLSRRLMTKREATFLQTAIENVMRQGLIENGVAFDWRGFATFSVYTRQVKQIKRVMLRGQIITITPTRALRIKCGHALKRDLNPK